MYLNYLWKEAEVEAVVEAVTKAMVEAVTVVEVTDAHLPHPSSQSIKGKSA
jgi:hypothetical protein